MTKNFSLPCSLLLTFITAACTVGPNYERPPAETPGAYKESKDWLPAQPMDAIDRGAWWSVYQDPILNALEKQIDISNQNLKASEAAYRSAVALADETRAGLFPIVALNPSAQRNGTGKHNAATSYDLSAGASWAVDIWGKIRREVESEEASAQASAADLALARLSAQGELATDYFALRVQDELERTYEQTVNDDQKIVNITRNQYTVGVAAQSDMLSAQSTMESAQAAAANAALQRAQLEHAIAVLVGQPPSDFSLPATTTLDRVPLIPAEIPSALLQRRPDIASAERQMAAANANIGVAEAAYYPSLTLSASYGFGAGTLGSLFSAGSTLWSLGAAGSETLIDFGARDAATEQARADFDQSIATYRQTVLTSFQAVEDNLAAQRILVDQEKAQSVATNDARKAEQIALNQYKEGIVPFNTVLTAQVLTLNDQQASLTVLNSRLAASVALIEALGGGWDASLLPSP